MGYKELVKHHTQLIKDQNENKWELIETSDLEEICEAYHKDRLKSMSIFEKDLAKESLKKWLEVFSLSIEEIREFYKIRINLGKEDEFTSLLREYIINDYEFDMLYEEAEELHFKVDESLCELEREAAGNMLLRIYPEYWNEVYNDTESDY